MSLLARLRRLATRRRDRKQRPEEQRFLQACEGLGPEDIAIDCGANVGKFTVAMARTGARVFAFEPHPAAYQELVQATQGLPNVTTLNAAVTATPGPVRLYLHRWDERDPVHWSTGSSIVEAKRNVRADRYVEVEGVDLVQFIEELAVDRVQLLKMDIEGAEVEVLNALLDAGLEQRIDLAFVELHDRQIQGLTAPTRQLRERLESRGAYHFHLDWR